VTQRLAVLLSAGVSPVSAWHHAAASTGSTLAREVEDAADSIPDALVALSAELNPLDRGAWHGLAAAWAVATDAGAPLGPSLRRYASSLRDLSQTQRDAAVALAAPTATARLVMALPLVGVLFSLALGFDTLGVLFGTPLGWGCLATGIALMAVAARWSRWLTDAAQPRDASPGIGCDLMAIAVSGGGSLDRARQMIDAAVIRFHLPGVGTSAEEILDLSRAAGVPAAELLRCEAEEQRRQARTDAQARAAALSVQLMLPLGLCVLPAFMVLGVLPMLLAVISSTVGRF